MKVGIVQPYFFPYLGYWQLVNAVDQFILLDTVNYIKKGWINRNRILVQGQPHFVTMPLNNASQNKKINSLTIHSNGWHRKVLSTIEQNYSKADNFHNMYPVLKELLSQNERSLINTLECNFRKVCELIGIKTPIMKASKLDQKGLTGQEYIIDLCRQVEATCYINPIGGIDLYNHEKFKKMGIDLNFLKMTANVELNCSQINHANLSIIDLLMRFVSPEIYNLLTQYQIITESN